MLYRLLFRKANLYLQVVAEKFSHFKTFLTHRSADYMVEVALPCFALFFLLQGKFSGIPDLPRRPRSAKSLKVLKKNLQRILKN